MTVPTMADTLLDTGQVPPPPAHKAATDGRAGARVTARLTACVTARPRARVTARVTDSVTVRAPEAQYPSLEPLMGRPLTCAALALLLAGCSADLDLGSNDAGIPYDAECRLGTYSGTYDCTTTSGSSFPLSGISGNGAIAITLVPAGAHSLALTPDASISTTSSGATSTSSLTGVLDCSTRKLVGTDGHVTFSSASFMGMVS